MRQRRTLICVVFLALTCCASRAEKDGLAAMKHGNYESAATYFEAALRSDPEDEALRARLWDARRKALDVHLQSYETQRRSGDQDGALRAMEDALTLDAQWKAGRDAPRELAEVHKRLGAAVVWSGETVSHAVEEQLTAGRPRGAQLRLRAANNLLQRPELSSMKAQLSTQVQAAGEARCTERRSSDAAKDPFVLAVVRAYCAEFQISIDEPAAAPEQATQVVVEGMWEGAPRGANGDLEAALTEALSKTPWYHAKAGRSVLFAMRGSARESKQVRNVQRERPWTEQVPHQELQSYQQSYQAMEYYTVSEPYTTYSSGTCGYGTSSYSCSRPTTQYRSVQKSRMVTKYRPATRMVTVLRPEPRVFHYDAQEHTSELSLTLSGNLMAAGWSGPLALEHSDVRREQGDEHLITFDQAGVRPEKPRFTSLSSFFVGELQTISTRATQRLREFWGQTYCAADDTEITRTARCMKGYPNDAHAVSSVATFLGDDASGLTP